MLNSITSASPAEIAKQKQAQKSQNQVNSSYEYAPDWMFENSNAGKVGDNLQVSASSADTNNTTPAETGDAFSDKCSDGEDDGRIGFGTALLQMAKGAGKSIVNTVVGIATDPKKALLAAGTIAACTLCPPLAVGLGAVGIATGVISGAKAVGKAVELYNDPNGTDTEAKAAFQDIGASALQVGVSVAGVKAGVKAMKATPNSSMSQLTKSGETGIKGAIENGKNTVKAFAEDTVSGGRGLTKVNGKLKINTGEGHLGYKGTQAYTKVKANIGKEGVIGSAKTGVTKTAGKISQMKTAKTIPSATKTAKAASKLPGKYTKFAKDSGYQSGFGALTAPAAYELRETNEVSNYDMVQLGKMNTTATGSRSRYTPGMYEFSHDWMDKI